MQLLVQNCLDPSRATEIFSVPKRRIFALPKIVRYRNKSGLQYLVTAQRKREKEILGDRSPEGRLIFCKVLVWSS